VVPAEYITMVNGKVVPGPLKRQKVGMRDMTVLLVTAVQVVDLALSRMQNLV